MHDTDRAVFLKECKDRDIESIAQKISDTITYERIFSYCSGMPNSHPFEA
jgi:hypothetical protein